MIKFSTLSPSSSLDLIRKFSVPLLIFPRSFATNRVSSCLDDSCISRRQRRHERGPFSSLFSDGFHPLIESTEKTTNLSQIMTMMAKLMENQIQPSKWAAHDGDELRRCWNVREEDDGLYFRFDMPGLEKEDVKVMVDNNNTLVISGEKIESEEADTVVDGEVTRYNGRIDLPDGYRSTKYTADQIKAEMKKGVLKLFIPRINNENLLPVNIE